MPDGARIGVYQESGLVIPCLLTDEPANTSAMMFLNGAPPMSAGHEISGFPKR